MFIVKFYTHLVLYSGLYYNTYAMLDRSEKHPQQQYRQDRQFRPILNSIIFLIAANLVAKGALGLGAYQTPLPGNIQGSLFLTLNSPQGAQIPPQYIPVLYPAGHTGQPGSGTQAPRPVAQTQVVHIGEPFEEVEDFKKDIPYTQKLYIHRYNSIEDPLDTSSSEEVTMKAKLEETTEATIESTTQEDTELLPQNFTNTDEELIEIARQNSPTTPTTTTTTTATTTTTTTTAPVTDSMPPESNQEYAPPNLVYGAPNTGYGPPNTGYAPPSVSYGVPINTQNISGMNITTKNTTNNGTGYYYLPSGHYGPYTGKENVSISYGPPQNTNTGYPQRPFYPKPFFSSPSDPYLNNYDQYYNNFYNNPSYYNNMYKYNDFFKNFYNKFDYNSYPSFYNNYLGKWN